MALDDFKPTRNARQITMVILLRNEGPELEGYQPDRDFVPMIEVMRDGWREILAIWTGAMVHYRRIEREKREPE